MSSYRVSAAGLLVAFVVLLGSVVPGHAGSSTHVYLLRGFMNVFSLELDTMAAKIERHGIQATVANHLAAEGLGEEAARDYKAGKVRNIIIVGHSLGGPAAFEMASVLKEKKVPVSLIVVIDGPGISDIPSNVHRVVNYYVNFRIERPAGYRGQLVNLDQSKNPNIGHLSIASDMESKILGTIYGGAGSGGSASSASAGTAAQGAAPASPGAPKSTSQ